MNSEDTVEKFFALANEIDQIANKAWTADHEYVPANLTKDDIRKMRELTVEMGKVLAEEEPQS